MIDPKDIISEFTVDELCQTAEDYFQSIEDPTYQLAKPFSCFVETPAMLQNMGLLLSEMQLGKSMTVLEFGAGTCWFSKFLNQMQCITISCDTSETALELGRRLFDEYPIVGNVLAEPVFLHFDGYSLDIASESVDRIICFDAFHHIPNQQDVLAEFARVLKSGGIVGFSEPGRFHSQTSASQSEMRNYNVLENDIDLEEIFSIAKDVGFSDVKCKLLCDMNLSLDQYKRLMQGSCGKKDSSGILDNIKSVMSDKSIFFLYKGESVPDSRSHIGLCHSINVSAFDFCVCKDEKLTISITIYNKGKAVWLSHNVNDYGVVKVGTHLYHKDGKLLDFDFSRHCIENPPKPGKKIDMEISLDFENTGVYVLVVDLVAEGVCWFENIGSSSLKIKVAVD